MKRTNQLGRSMVEMLGVLAIVGLLSIGGIKSFQIAMCQYKLQKLADEYNMFISDVLRYKEDFRRTQLHEYPNGFFHIGQVTEQMHLLPSNWRYKNFAKIIDSTGNYFVPFIRGNNTQRLLNFEFSIQKDGSPIAPVDFCKTLIHKVIIPNQEFINMFRIYEADTSSSNSHDMWFGTTSCFGRRNCLSDITINNIDDICRSCSGEKPKCHIIIDFK